MDTEIPSQIHDQIHVYDCEVCDTTVEISYSPDMMPQTVVCEDCWDDVTSPDPGSLVTCDACQHNFPADEMEWFETRTMGDENVSLAFCPKCLGME